MKTIIEISDWIKNSIGWINKNTGKVIKEKKCNNKLNIWFEYFNENDQYLGRYNSTISMFKDGLMINVLDSQYGR